MKVSIQAGHIPRSSNQIKVRIIDGTYAVDPYIARLNELCHFVGAIPPWLPQINIEVLRKS